MFFAVIICVFALAWVVSSITFDYYPATQGNSGVRVSVYKVYADTTLTLSDRPNSASISNQPYSGAFGYIGGFSMTVTASIEGTPTKLEDPYTSFGAIGCTNGYGEWTYSETNENGTFIHSSAVQIYRYITHIKVSADCWSSMLPGYTYQRIWQAYDMHSFGWDILFEPIVGQIQSIGRKPNSTGAEIWQVSYYTRGDYQPIRESPPFGYSGGIDVRQTDGIASLQSAVYETGLPQEEYPFLYGTGISESQWHQNQQIAILNGLESGSKPFGRPMIFMTQYADIDAADFDYWLAVDVAVVGDWICYENQYEEEAGDIQTSKEVWYENFWKWLGQSVSTIYQSLQAYTIIVLIIAAIVIILLLVLFIRDPSLLKMGKKTKWRRK